VSVSCIDTLHFYFGNWMLHVQSLSVFVVFSYIQHNLQVISPVSSAHECCFLTSILRCWYMCNHKYVYYYKYFMYVLWLIPRMCGVMTLEDHTVNRTLVLCFRNSLSLYFLGDYWAYARFMCVSYQLCCVCVITSNVEAETYFKNGFFNLYLGYHLLDSYYYFLLLLNIYYLPASVYSQRTSWVCFRNVSGQVVYVLFVFQI
jgi:hypothetical protein